MPVLHLDNVPNEVYEPVVHLALAHNRTVEAEAVSLLRQALFSELGGRSQGELLANLRRRSFTPPPGTPDSVELLREDRER
jgi:plasmid stability protein